jgi:hypothetical protein
MPSTGPQPLLRTCDGSHLNPGSKPELIGAHPNSQTLEQQGRKRQRQASLASPNTTAHDRARPRLPAFQQASVAIANIHTPWSPSSSPNALSPTRLNHSTPRLTSPRPRAARPANPREPDSPCAAPRPTPARPSLTLTDRTLPTPASKTGHLHSHQVNYSQSYLL